MAITFTFLKIFGMALLHVSPLLFFLLMVILVLGLVIGRLEKWLGFDAVYFAFVTATTVGYGDLRPRLRLSRMLSVLVAIIGLVFTGLIVAIAVYALGETFSASP